MGYVLYILFYIVSRGWRRRRKLSAIRINEPVGFKNALEGLVG